MKLCIEDVKDLFRCIENEIQKEKDYLIKLDSDLGDGDLGITSVHAFEAVVEALDNFQENDVGKALSLSGMEMANKAAATIGILLGTAMMGAGQVVSGKTQITLENIVTMGYECIEGIKRRGKAKQGDKTLLDSLIPAVEGLEQAANERLGFYEAFNMACENAYQGLEKTKTMISKFGRAKYYGENSKGKPDPGAALICVIFKASREFFSGFDEKN